MCVYRYVVVIMTSFLCVVFYFILRRMEILFVVLLRQTIPRSQLSFFVTTVINLLLEAIWICVSGNSTWLIVKYAPPTAILAPANASSTLLPLMKRTNTCTVAQLLAICCRSVWGRNYSRCVPEITQGVQESQTVGRIEYEFSWIFVFIARLCVTTLFNILTNFRILVQRRSHTASA